MFSGFIVVVEMNNVKGCDSMQCEIMMVGPAIQFLLRVMYSI